MLGCTAFHCLRLIDRLRPALSYAAAVPSARPSPGAASRSSRAITVAAHPASPLAVPQQQMAAVEPEPAAVAPEPAAVAPYCLCQGGVCAPCALSSGQWLQLAPRGAYTTARTVGRGRVFELSQHVQRLATSALLMMQADCQAGKPGAEALLAAHVAELDAARLRPAVVASLHAAMEAYRAAAPGREEQELRPTVLLTWTQEEGLQVATHVGPLPPRPAAPVKAQVRGGPRSNALAKDSEWVRQRLALEAGAGPGVNEVLLADGKGRILEGLSSNFFAVVDGAVQTAGEGVLAGTVREVALLVAEREGIPVDLTPPCIEDIGRWEGAFISSTSRLVLPLDEVSLLDAEPPLVRSFPRGGLVARLEQLVLQEIEGRSEALDP